MAQPEDSVRTPGPASIQPIAAPIRGWGERLALPAVVVTVVPAMVLAVGVVIALISWHENVVSAQSMAEARLDDAWRRIDHDLTCRFGCSDALLGQVEAVSRRLDGSQDPMAWYTSLAPLFTGRSELTYASFSTPDGRFFGVFSDQGTLAVNFNDQGSGGHRRRWKVEGTSATPIIDTVGFAYDPRQRPFWSAALSSDGMVWTRPYRFISPTTQVGITRAHAIYSSDHRLLGVATVDWTTAALSRTLTEAGLGIAERLIVATDAGEILVTCGAPVPPARPPEAPIELVQDLGDPVASAIFSAGSVPASGLITLADPGNGRSYLAIRRPLNARLGWTLALAARRDPLLAPARRHLAINGLVIILIMPFALLTAWMYARHVLRMNRAAHEARDAATAAEAIAQQLRIEQERQKLEQLSMLGLLAGGIAHDVRNSLTCVTGIADMLRSGTHGPEQLLKFADLLFRSGEQANDLCDDLLNFARKGSGAPEIFDAHAAVRTAVSVFGTTGRGVSVDLSQLVAERHHLHGSRHQLQNAILNLCLNARDALKGAGVICISSSVLEVTAVDDQPRQSWLQSRGPHLRVTVTDSGEGMDAETLGKCLEPLFTTKGEMGTGLGLVTVQRVVKEHRGSLEIVSKLGIGTTVTIVLPLVHAPQ
jgi:signal transduction histidine kinase